MLKLMPILGFLKISAWIIQSFGEKKLKQNISDLGRIFLVQFLKMPFGRDSEVFCRPSLTSVDTDADNILLSSHLWLFSA